MRVERAVPTVPARVLFICAGNSARSQIAEALLREMGGSRFVAASAGTEPKGVDPDTIRVLAARGIDWSGARSKSVTEFQDESWDCVITVCDRARWACPVFPGPHTLLHWDLDDPAAVTATGADRLAAFESTAREIEVRLAAFLSEPPGPSISSPRP